jgi:FAD/FMN-containing dehydrogenase
MDLASITLDDLQARQLAQPPKGRKGGWRLTPESAGQVADLLHWAQDSDRKIAMSAADAEWLDEPLWLDLSRLNQVRQHSVEDFTIQMETGITFGDLAALLEKHQQELPLSYPKDTLLADILAEDRPALETGLRGYPRDYVLKTEIATPDGQLTLSGADVVKNATGYDLHKLYTGARHAFGVVTAVTLKLVSLPSARECWQYSVESDNAAYSFSAKLLSSQLPLRVCELYREDGQWKFLVEIAGDSAQLKDAANLLIGMSEEQPRFLGAPQCRTILLQSLQNGPTKDIVLEAVLPVGGWPNFVDALLQRPDFHAIRFHVRPAAGLVYISGESMHVRQIEAIAAEARHFGGFVQVVQAPFVIQEQGIQLMATLAEYNLPRDETARRLLKALKSGYDPKGILFCPQLPL